MGRAGRIDLVRHLEYFVVIAESGHIGRAADRLDMSQPPLSQGLQRLEARLGAPLFERHARGVRLTDAGAALLPRARRLIDAARDILPAEPGPSGLRLGLAPSVPTPVVTALTSGLRTAGGGTVALLAASSVALIDQVAAGRIDLAVVTHPAVLGAVTGGPVIRLPTRVLVADHHLEPAAGTVALPTLRALPLALAPRDDNPSVYDLNADIAGRAGITISRQAVPDDRAALVAAAGGGMMALTADVGLGGVGVTGAALNGDPLPLRLRLIWPADEMLAPGADVVTQAQALLMAATGR